MAEWNVAAIYPGPPVFDFGRYCFSCDFTSSYGLFEASDYSPPFDTKDIIIEIEFFDHRSCQGILAPPWQHLPSAAVFEPVLAVWM